MRLFILSFIICLVSCNSNQQQASQDIKKPALSVEATHSKPVALNPNFEDKLENWNEYNTLTTFMTRFRKISPNEAISNAIELNGLVQKVNDSIRPVFLKTPAFRARTNILLNESLRFSDMVTISSISADEVNAQVDKVIQAYSSLNAKINMTLSRQELEDEIEIGKHNVLLKEQVPTIKKPQRLEADKLQSLKNTSIKKKN